MALSVRDEGRVRVLTIDRPESMNAMNNEVFASIRDALSEAEPDDEVAVVVLTGRGDSAFSAGQDLTELLAAKPGTHQFPEMLETVTSFRKPLLAAVNGLGVGIGMTVLAHCDLVLMADNAKLRTPFPQLGLAPEAGSSYTFAQRVGWQNAAYVLLSGRWFNAKECLDMGFVWRVCAPESLEAETLEVAGEIAANPIPSLIATKTLMLESTQRRVDAIAAHRSELQAYEPLLGGAANREAVAAFLEKRDPDFSTIPGL